MYVISSSSSGLKIEEENNVVRIKSSRVPRANEMKVTVKVPFSTSVKVKSFLGGAIEVSGVNGDIEANHKNGDIRLTDVSGNVVAHTMNGEVKVIFKKVNLDKPMSFSSFNGSIDVTFPANAKYNFKMKTDHGDIYSDFKLKTIDKPTRQAPQRKNGRFVVKFEKTVYAELNGGGEEVTFKTYRGDIYIRKLK